MATAGLNAKTVAAALYAECRLVSEFIANDVRLWLLAPGVPSGADAVVLGQFLRIDAWLRTLKKCDEPGDFQAVISATRALLEATIDLVLLASNPMVNAQLIQDWEDSARLKSAMALTAYYAKQKIQPQPEDEHATIMEFGAHNQVRITAVRQSNNWIENSKNGPKPKHPDRWTGNNLSRDAQQADAVYPEFGFERFYETRYRELCWNTHGSGLAGARGVSADLFPFIGGRAFRECADLAEHAARVTLRHFKIWGTPQEEGFKKLDLERKTHLAFAQGWRP
jgi:hypothetical protein